MWLWVAMQFVCNLLAYIPQERLADAVVLFAVEEGVHL
jgi:hypothetical protein